MNFSNIVLENVWAYDIETAANVGAGAFHKKFLGTITAPKNIKDPEKIKAAIAEKIRKETSKDALSWVTGRIVSIAIVSVADVINKVKKPRRFAFCGMNEKKLLEAFAAVLADNANGIFYIVGKNNSSFDDSFVIGRCLVNDVAIPELMKNSYNMLDVDRMICGRTGSSNVTSLSKYCFALGLEDKLMDGSTVPKLFAKAFMAHTSGNTEEYKKIMLDIKAYNIDDAVKTAEIAGRLLK